MAFFFQFPASPAARDHAQIQEDPEESMAYRPARLIAIYALRPMQRSDDVKAQKDGKD